MSVEDNEPRMRILDDDEDGERGLNAGEIDEILNRPVEPYAVPGRTQAPARKRQEA